MMLHNLSLSPRALKAIAKWADDGPDAADVMILRVDEQLLVGQGDDRAVFDAAGCVGEDDGTISTAPAPKVADAYAIGWHSDDPQHCHVAKIDSEGNHLDDLFDVTLYDPDVPEGDSNARDVSLAALTELVARANASLQ